MRAVLAVLLALGFHAVQGARAAELQVTGKLSILNSIGTTAASSELHSPLPSTVPVSSENTLKLSFSLTSSASTSDESVQPQQAVISWVSESTGEDYTSIIKVRKSGTAKFELDFARAPSALLSLPSPIKATLLLADYTHAPLSLPLGTFSLASNLVPSPAKVVKAWESERYAEQEGIEWTYRAAEKSVGSIKVLLGLGLVLGPWFGLPFLMAHLSLPSPTLTTPKLLFLASIFAFEGLTVSYWVGLQLLPTLKYFALLAVAVLVAGRSALGEMREKRLRGAKKSE